MAATEKTRRGGRADVSVVLWWLCRVTARVNGKVMLTCPDKTVLTAYDDLTVKLTVRDKIHGHYAACFTQNSALSYHILLMSTCVLLPSDLSLCPSVCCVL